MPSFKQTSKTYLVGGAVRDKLLGLDVVERDWVVVGSSAEEMKAAGFTQVGKDFPVFLHPETKEEYALARKERKVLPGHTGFEFDANSSITLEEDLGRRDLTINAIAQDEYGVIIDPYNGRDDIDSKTLRHVAHAFTEDPLRVLRLARFAARFAELGFRINPETHELCADMVALGDLDELSPERIFQEMDKALATPQPQVFFNFLRDIKASVRLWPEVSSDALILPSKVLAATNKVQRFALLFATSAADEVEARCRALRAPRQYQDLALLCSRHLRDYKQVMEMNAGDIVGFIYQLDGIRRPDRFEEFCMTCQLILNGGGNTTEERDQQERLISSLASVSRITSKDVSRDLRGPQIGEAIRQLQISAVAALQD
ncbi:MAG: multifunctional CCA tRNA nucleotidyl transferase/2'3'-cyclic phosphodiesterase/2'nucleotidase/phosphatase [Pseudomonadales bacterium]